MVSYISALELCSITGCSMEHATQLLEAYNGEANIAAEAFFSGEYEEVIARSRKKKRNSSQRAPRQQNIDAWFDRFRDYDAELDEINETGFEAFYDELGLNTQDILVLALAHAMSAADMGSISRQEFTTGMMRLGVDTPQQLQAKFPDMRKNLQDHRSALFKEVYVYTFDFAREEQLKTLSIEDACALWSILLPSEAFPLVEPFREYILGNGASILGGRAGSEGRIHRDLWVQMPLFMMHVGQDFAHYDLSDAWPVILDEFAEYMCSEAKKRETSGP